jgi:hypothetical protein
VGEPADVSKVAGQCPMGCGETLFLGESGHITCSVLDCPDPGAADDALTIGSAVRGLRFLVADARRSDAAASRAADLSLFERALVVSAFAAGQREVLDPLRKAVGTAAETVSASTLWGAIGGRATLDRLLSRHDDLRRVGEDSARGIIDAALQCVEREEASRAAA